MLMLQADEGYAGTVNKFRGGGVGGLIVLLDLEFYLLCVVVMGLPVIHGDDDVAELGGFFA
jgi:hypothetical protein